MTRIKRLWIKLKKYLFLFCQSCTRDCSYYKDCVRCKIYETGPLVGQCDEKCNATIIRVPDVESRKTILSFQVVDYPRVFPSLSLDQLS